MQFDRDQQGNLNPLPKPCVDTGMGLERTAAVLQGVISNYDTDLFQPLIGEAALVTMPNSASPERSSGEHQASLRVIADHARASTFLINDGVIPSNEGRGYVLRKIIRRAISHGRLLGQAEPFFYKMPDAVRRVMEDAYPELNQNIDRIKNVLLAEETRFAHTLDIGLKKLEQDLDAVLAEKRLAANPDVQTELEKVFGEGASWGTLKPRADATYSGEKAFKLYDTFGLPFDFIMDACRDRGVSLGIEGFERAMSEQRERARASWKGGAKQAASPIYRELGKTVFEGYRVTASRDCEVLAIVK